MDESAIGRLTEGQRACLRLVLEHKQTKQIARELGIAPDTVKQRLGIAMRTLGVDTRVQAAFLLQDHEKVHPRGVYPPQPIVGRDPAAAGMNGADELPQGEGQRSLAVTAATDHPASASETSASPISMETQNALTLGWLMTASMTKLGIGRPEPAGAGAGNRLTPIQRILLIVFIAIGSVLSITGLVSATKELVALRR